MQYILQIVFMTILQVQLLKKVILGVSFIIWPTLDHSRIQLYTKSKIYVTFLLWTRRGSDPSPNSSASHSGTMWNPVRRGLELGIKPEPGMGRYSTACIHLKWATRVWDSLRNIFK